MNETSQAFTRGRAQGYDAGLDAGRAESAATIKALVEALDHCKECAGDTVTMPTSVIHVICDAAIAAAKETT